MLGWEFPPHSRGGLGTACHGLTKGLSTKNVDVVFVLPKGKRSAESSHINMIFTENLYIENKKLKFHHIDTMLYPYMTSEEYKKEYSKHIRELAQRERDEYAESIYGKDLFEEVERFADKVKVVASFEDFDIIHAHDWMTYKAGVSAKEKSGKPLVVHMHATEFDRTGGNVNQHVYDIERYGMHMADKVIAVSNFTKDKVVHHYGIDPSKIQVVHNGVYFNDNEVKQEFTKNENEKIVLFLGRLTLQKGPDYFLETAKRVLDMMPNVRFVVAGSGDMYGRMIERAADLGIGKNVLFTGHLTGREKDLAYQMADLYVMPSVSEPFGITPLESMKNDTPVLMSKQSGVSEVVRNALKVDFWDIDEMTNKIVSVLKYNSIGDMLRTDGKTEVRALTWDVAAEKCMDVYDEVLRTR